MEGELTTIRCDNTISCTELDKPPTLTALQEIVGGLIQIIPRFTTFQDHRCVAFCNEEGLIHRLPVNGIVSVLWHQMGIPESEIILGDVAIVTGDDELFRAL